jgi:hypothetical protein
VKGRAEHRRIVDVLGEAWRYIDQRFSPYVSDALVDLALAYFAKTLSEREKLQELAAISGLDAQADDAHNAEQIKQARQQLEQALLDQGGFRSWLAGAWVVVSVRAPWSFFVALSALASVPIWLALDAFRVLH